MINLKGFYLGRRGLGGFGVGVVCPSSRAAERRGDPGVLCWAVAFALPDGVDWSPLSLKEGKGD